MTLEELENDPSSRFIEDREEPEPAPVVGARLALPPAPPPKSQSPYQLEIGPLWEGKWQCKACEVWVSGPPKPLCDWCEEHREEIEYIRGEILDDEHFRKLEGIEVMTDDHLPRHIFPMVNKLGQKIYATITEDGRLVELEN